MRPTTGVYNELRVLASVAPATQTPILDVPLSYDHLSVIGAVTPEERVFFKMQTQAFHGPEVVKFLEHLLQHISGKLLMIWDVASIHRGKAVKDFLTAGGSKRIYLERLPGYAPELNPAEGLWGAVIYNLKRRKRDKLATANADDALLFLIWNDRFNL